MVVKCNQSLRYETYINCLYHHLFSFCMCIKFRVQVGSVNKAMDAAVTKNKIALKNTAPDSTL